MLRAFFPLFFLLLPAFAWAQQTPPPPDTQPARERHRLKEKEAPPPEGPWGPDQAGFTFDDPVWRGAFLGGGAFYGSNIQMRVPQGVAAISDGINPPIFERLQYHVEKFRATSGSITLDYDVFRLSATGFGGTFDVATTLTYDDSFNPPSVINQNLHGSVYGFRVGAYWPALRYRDSLLEVSLGPIASVGWMHQEVSNIPGAQLLVTDSIDELTGSLGPKISLRALLGRFSLELNAEYSYMSAPSSGWTKEFTVGVGYKF
jgi:hypothetical protein